MAVAPRRLFLLCEPMNVAAALQGDQDHHDSTHPQHPLACFTRRVDRAFSARRRAAGDDDATGILSLLGPVRLPGTPVLAMNDGVPSFSFALDDPPTAFLDDLAAALMALRGVDVAAARGAGLVVVDDLGRAELARQLDETQGALEASARLRGRWRSILDDDAHWSLAPALSHGDLHPGHWLVDDEHRLLGVLDWTEAKVTHPGTDLAMLFGCCGGRALSALLTRMTALGLSSSTATALS